MKPTLLLGSVLVSGALSFVIAQQPSPELQGKVAALKEKLAANKAALKQYKWTETVELNVKGETKSKKQSECRYGPDGKVQKTPIGEQAPQQQKSGPKGRLGKRVVEKKKDEFKDYLEKVGELVKSYVPPEGELMSAAAKAGNASVQKGNETITALLFKNYVKKGDEVSLTMNSATSQLATFQVKSYLEDDPKDAVNLTVSFQNLPDGTRYVAQTILDAAGKKTKVTTTNSGYQKLSQ